MTVEVENSSQFQGTIVATQQRRGMISAAKTATRSPSCAPRCRWPICSVTRRSSRSLSQGMAGFTMELCRFGKVPNKIAEEIIAARRKEQLARK